MRLKKQLKQALLLKENQRPLRIFKNYKILEEFLKIYIVLKNLQNTSGTGTKFWDDLEEKIVLCLVCLASKQ